MHDKTGWVKAGVCALIGIALPCARPAPALAATPHADEARPMARTAHLLRYVHLYSDSRGVSHFRVETLEFEASAARGAGGPGLSAPHELLAYPLPDTRGATLLLLKRGAREDWHRAPRRQWLIVIQGKAQVTASDGTVRRFGVGSVLLMDDTTGKGHITQAVGKVDHIALIIPVRAR